MSQSQQLTRRAMMATGLALTGVTPSLAQSVWPAGRQLAFDIWRNDHNIGRHVLTFRGSATDFVVGIDARMTVGLGPITLFEYHHQASETWRSGAFVELQSQTVTNGKQEQLLAIRTANGVLVKSKTGAHTLPGAALPLTHWNQHAFQSPLFNPETGAAMREAVSRQNDQTLRLADARSVQATRYILSGDAEIVDWYDAGGVWAALRGKVHDGSFIDYRRAV